MEHNDKKNLDRVKWALNITDQEVSEALAIDLDEVKKDKSKGDTTTSFGSIISGWWSNNWCE